MARDHNLSLNIEFMNKKKEEFIKHFKVKQSTTVFCLSVTALHELKHSWHNFFTKTFTSKIVLIDFIEICELIELKLLFIFR